MKVPPAALIFDLDGTLLDSRPGIVESFGRAAKSVLPEVPLDLCRVPVGPPIRRLCQTVFPGIQDAELDLMVKAYRADYDERGWQNTRLYDGAGETLSRCARNGLTLHAATNKPRKVTMALLARLRIDGYFRAVVTVDSAEPPFPSKAAMIAHLMDAQRMDAAATIYVGDTAEDAAAAVECGIGFIWAAYGYGKLNGPEPALRAINKLAELAEWLYMRDVEKQAL